MELAKKWPDGHPQYGAFDYLHLTGFVQILDGTENFSECPRRLEMYSHFTWDHGMFMHFVDTVSSIVCLYLTEI